MTLPGTEGDNRDRTGRPEAAVRARDLGIVIGDGTPGPLNAITDVVGVRVGHCTLVTGDGPLVRGHGPVRTGVTVVLRTKKASGANKCSPGTTG